MTDIPRFPSLDQQMTEAVRHQLSHIADSHAVDRRGWSRQQWVEDAERLMGDLHGSVLDLLNGHVVYMLEELRFLRAKLARLQAEGVVSDEDRRAIAEDVRVERTADAADRGE